MTDTAPHITARYSQENGAGLGCADLSPYLDVREGERSLDLGCGSGGQALRVSELAGDNGYTAGLDITPGMITKARDRDLSGRIDFRTGDMRSLPFEDGIFSLVVSNCAINHTPDKLAVYREIFRVLESGGRFVVGDVMAWEKLPASVSEDPVAVSQCWGGAIPLNDYLGIIAACGFKDVKVLSNRRYFKNGYGLESAVIRGVKP